uniref:Cathepsin propeptide inhibitor domain-containing protein n=1 Tax=Strongyloides stercoralis TaxID=6248 RepID=A0A0K0EMF1_STRER
MNIYIFSFFFFYILIINSIHGQIEYPHLSKFDRQWVRVLRTEAWHYYNKEFYKRRLYEALIEEKKKKLGPRILNANLFGPNFTTDPSKAFIDTERIYHPKWELNN